MLQNKGGRWGKGLIYCGLAHSSDGDGDSNDGDSGNNDSNSGSGSGDSNSGKKNNNQLKAAVEKVATAVDAALASILLASLAVQWASSQGSAECIILSAHAESIILSAPPTKSMILSALLAESMILSACAESIILSAGSAKQQPTKSCSRKFGNNGGVRGNSGGGDGFDIGSGNNDCS